MTKQINTLALKYPYEVLLETCSLPLKADSKKFTIATSKIKQNQFAKYLKQLGETRKIVFKQVSEKSIQEQLSKIFKDQNNQKSLDALRYSRPKESAHIVFTMRQKAGLWIAGLGVLTVLAMNFESSLFLMFVLINISYLIFNISKISMLMPSFGNVFLKFSKNGFTQKNWPTYSILVPLYKETNVMPGLVKHLSELDYPNEKLQIIILLEQDDTECIAKAKQMGLPYGPFEVCIVPSAPIQTKPRACNYGLQTVRGEYCVIYDAEDRPQKDQLKKAVMTFNKSAKNTICVQAKLHYYNPYQNWLTRCFTMEYLFWFNHYLPSLHRFHGPIPLGGTSNHFVTEKLKEVGGWDPYNVTEDADLGIRLFKFDYHTVVMDSITWEEANSKIPNWIRQRSRWQKGYVQTFLVHMRHPVKLLKQMGIKGFMFFLATFGSHVFCPVVNPILLFMTVYLMIFPFSREIVALYPSVMYIAWLNLAIGVLAYSGMHFAAAIKSKYYRLMGWSLTIPVYWFFISWACWKGIIQLFTKPFYWEKTIHGLADDAIALESLT